jgi:WD40 repeat protein
MLKIQTDFWYIEQLRYSHASHNLIAIGTKRTGTDNRPKMAKAFDPRASSPEPDRWFEFPPTALIAFDPTGQHGAVAKRLWNDDYIYFVQFDEREPTFGSRSISVASRELVAIAISADGKKLAGLVNAQPDSATWHGIRIWSSLLEKALQEIQINFRAEQLIYSSNGRHIAVCREDGKNLKLLRPSTGKVTSLAVADAFRIVFSPSGKYLASGGQFIRCWTTSFGKMISRFRGQDEDIPDLAFSPDERFLTIARTDGPVEFWDFREPRLVRSYSWDIGRLSAIAIAPDGLTCAVAGENGQIVIWDLDDL